MCESINININIVLYEMFMCYNSSRPNNKISKCHLSILNDFVFLARICTCDINIEFYH